MRSKDRNSGQISKGYTEASYQNKENTNNIPSVDFKIMQSHEIQKTILAYFQFSHVQNH
jgi:hypothetical protein